jgi:hypothetical protein
MTMKNDVIAREHWGSDLYDRIPKSVFAVVAWHLANIASDSPDFPEAAMSRFVEEVEALEANGLIPEGQARAVIRAFGKTFTGT